MAALIDEAKKAALAVLLHNMRGPFEGLPRTAGWGYPEPYTRDLMLSSLGILVTGNDELIQTLRRVLESLARTQTRHGLISGLAHDPRDLGSSDTTPLFLFGLALFRRATGEANFLAEAAERALTWMIYQSPDDSGMIAQQPTSDWRDEQWVLGYGLFVNTISYAYLRMFGLNEQADAQKALINLPTAMQDRKDAHVHEGLALPDRPYYALWSYKVHGSDRFDLLGNSLAILTGIASPTKAREIVGWVESECRAMQTRGDLAVNVPPCLFPYIRPGDLDWHPRYERYNLPGDYHNGGVWLFIGALYIAALVSIGEIDLAEEKLIALSELCRPAREANVDWGFNEWLRAHDGAVRGQDWQTWSAALYLYAVAAVEQRQTPLLNWR